MANKTIISETIGLLKDRKNLKKSKEGLKDINEIARENAYNKGVAAGSKSLKEVYGKDFSPSSYRHGDYSGGENMMYEGVRNMVSNYWNNRRKKITGIK